MKAKVKKCDNASGILGGLLYGNMTRSLPYNKLGIPSYVYGIARINRTLGEVKEI
jgi:hypothetical protein